MKIWICDDAPGFLEEYKKLVLQQAEELCLHAEVRTFASGEEILSYARAGHQADVIFLDILMGELKMCIRDSREETEKTEAAPASPTHGCASSFPAHSGHCP